jgi:hypothetical protein
MLATPPEALPGREEGQVSLVIQATPMLNTSPAIKPPLAAFGPLIKLMVLAPPPAVLTRAQEEALRMFKHVASTTDCGRKPLGMVSADTLDVDAVESICPLTETRLLVRRMKS